MRPEIKVGDGDVWRPRPLDDTDREVGDGIRTRVSPLREEVTVACAPGTSEVVAPEIKTPAVSIPR